MVAGSRMHADSPDFATFRSNVASKADRRASPAVGPLLYRRQSLSLRQMVHAYFQHACSSSAQESCASTSECIYSGEQRDARTRRRANAVQRLKIAAAYDATTTCTAPIDSKRIQIVSATRRARSPIIWKAHCKTSCTGVGAPSCVRARVAWLLLSASYVLAAPHSPGHVFVLNTDLRYLACDAWALPVSESMVVDSRWQLPPCEIPTRPRDWGGGVRVMRTLLKSEEGQRRRRERRYKRYEHPQAYLVHALASDPQKSLSVDAILETLREFLKQAAAATPHSRFGRAKPLLAVPIFGADLATEECLQGQELSGVLILGMLQVLDDFVAKYPIDVALCTLDEAAFGAALQGRRKLFADFKRGAPACALDADAYRKEVKKLQELFTDGTVSLFLGAGVSINAGLPNWSSLIEMAASEIGVPDRIKDSLRQLNPLEAASVLAIQAGGETKLKKVVSKVIGSAKRFSLQHALLAGLPFRGCVTTNFDELFELAVRQIGVDMAVLPAEVGSVREHWCLKLHGTVTRADSIVLTRSDYARYSKEQAASEGVLQGLLLTQHVLFLGFSMRDENWCRIFETVRAPFVAAAEFSPSVLAQAAASNLFSNDASGDSLPSVQAPTQLGTMLPLERDPALECIWKSMLNVLPIDGLYDTARSGDSMAARARSLEIFLDYVTSEVEMYRCRILLNPKFQALLSPRSSALKKAIFDFLNALPTEAKRSGAFQPVQNLLLDMGLRTETLRTLIDDQSIEGPYRRRLSKILSEFPRSEAEYEYEASRPRPLLAADFETVAWDDDDNERRQTEHEEMPAETPWQGFFHIF